MPTVETKVCKNGNSAAITLPAEWRRREHIEVGDTVEVHYEYDGRLYVASKKGQRDKRKRALAELLDEVDKMPSVPWPDDSPEGDRRLLEEILGEKYA